MTYQSLSAVGCRGEGIWEAQRVVGWLAPRQSKFVILSHGAVKASSISIVTIINYPELKKKHEQIVNVLHLPIELCGSKIM